MSSYQTVRLNPVRVEGNQALELGSLLGPGGSRLLFQCVNALCDGESQLTRVASGFPWQRVSGETGHFQLQVLQDLPSGVDQLTVHLRLRGSIADVTHEARFLSADAAATNQLSAATRAVANRSVNRLLALTIASQLRERVAERVSGTVSAKVQSVVAMRLRSQNTIQTVARLRSGGVK